jgi:hypothetical protein
MNKKHKQEFIDIINKVLNSSQSKIANDDKKLLIEIRESLESAKSKEEIIAALGPVINLLQISIKVAFEIFQ